MLPTAPSSNVLVLSNAEAENPMTANLNLSKVIWIEEKAGGSLMSSYLRATIRGDQQLRLKSRQSLGLSGPNQAKDANEWLKQQPELYNELLQLTLDGCAVNLEWVSPPNQVVLACNKPALVVLSTRSNQGGKCLDLYELDVDKHPRIAEAWVP